MSKCVVCHEREAAVPDRERMGRPIKRVCRQCHAGRLIGDLKTIETERRRRVTDTVPAVVETFTVSSLDEFPKSS